MDRRILYAHSVALSADRTAPTLNSISVTGSPDAGVANTSVTVTLDISDDATGVYLGVISLQSPNGQGFSLQFHEGGHPLRVVRRQQMGYGRAGGADGFYRFSEPGTWRVSRLHLEDLAGNVRAYSGDDLALLGDTSFQVSNSKYDGIQPVLVKGEILTPVVSLSSDIPYVQTSVTVKDAGTNAPSGVDYVALYYCLPPVVNNVCSDYLQTIGSFGTPAKNKMSLITGYPVVSIQPASAGQSKSRSTSTLGTYELTHVIVVALDGTNAGYYSPLVGGGSDLRQWFPSLTVTLVP
jgi:hypothetical protein